MERYFETLQKIFNLHGGIIDLRLDRMSQALALFNHPENQFPSLHIAGTNGKGSTAALLHNILQQAGYRTALYTSPHLESFTVMNSKKVSGTFASALRCQISSANETTSAWAISSWPTRILSVNDSRWGEV
jgi:folylpolyglutamate synthase/dihydropteroate synthase